MTPKERRKEQKRQYEYIKDIRTRVQKGLTTTFAERNQMHIYDKKMAQKRKSMSNA
jgi:predicted DNA-binding protein (UPF0278 family)